MHILELENMELIRLKYSTEKEVFQLKTPKKVYFLKAESKTDMNFWIQKIQIQIHLIQQNCFLSQYEQKISDYEKIFLNRLNAIIFESFENIENLLYNNLLREWFFQYISTISPEEGGLLLLMEFYIKFKKELQAQNYKEAFKNCNRIYEIIRKVSDDWDHKTPSPEKKLPEPEERFINFKRPPKSILMSPTNLLYSNSEKKPQTKKTMYHTKNNTPSSEKKFVNTRPKILNNSLNLKKEVKNQINVKVEFEEIKPTKSKEIKKTMSRKMTNEDVLAPKINENLEKELIFHEDFFLKIFTNFDWMTCEKKFFYMKDVYLFDGIECQIVDLFGTLFTSVIKYLENNYYNPFLDSAFYKRKLLFFQIDKAQQRDPFQKPSFFEKKKEVSLKKILNFQSDNQTSNKAFKKKKVIAALPLQELQDLKYAQENPYTIFQESERTSILNSSVRKKFMFANPQQDSIIEEPSNVE